MRVTTVSFKKVVQVNQYEPEEILLTAEVEGTPVDEVIADLKATADRYFSGAPVVAEVVAEEPAKKKKAPAKKAPAKKEEEPVKEEEVVAEEPAKKEEAEEPAKKKAPAKKKSAKKEIPYDRNKMNHKQDIAGLFRKIKPDWNKVCKPLGQAISKDMHETPMYDADGSILASFEEIVRERFAAEA